MTIDQAYRFVQYVANKSQNGNITPDDFNLLAPIAQMSLLNDRLGNVKKYKPHDPVPPYGFGISQKTKEELGILSTNTSLPLTSGSADLPSDLLYLDTVVTSFPGGKLMTEVDVDEYMRLKDSVIKPPTAQAPVFLRAERPGGTFGIQVLPSMASCYIFYIRRPATPLWNYAIVFGRPVYATTGSQDFELSETVHMEICMRILAAVGINLDQSSISAYAELQEQKGS